MYNFHCINNKWNLIYLVPSDRKSGHPRGRKCSSSSSCVRAQSCLTLCNSMDCSLPGSSVHGIFQERILEWVTISFSRGSSQPKDWIGRWILYFWATREAQPGWGRGKEWMRVQKKTLENIFNQGSFSFFLLLSLEPRTFKVHRDYHFSKGKRKKP